MFIKGAIFVRFIGLSIVPNDLLYVWLTTSNDRYYPEYLWDLTDHPVYENEQL